MSSGGGYIISHSQRPILKPKIDTFTVNLTSKWVSPFSSQIHRKSWLSLPAKVVVAEQLHDKWTASNAN
jgi:hypothetical protein